MKLDVETTINASQEKIWEILGPKFGNISDWCASVNASSLLPRTGSITDAPSEGRHCDTVFGPFDETFLIYDPDKRMMRYQATSPKLPFFVKRLTNAFQVHDLGAGRSRVTMNSGAEMTQPFRTLMGPLMKMQMGKGLRELLGELKHYAETGQPHPRKLKANEKNARKKKAL